MSELPVHLAQLFIVIWPVILVIVFFAMLPGRGGLTGFLQRSRHSLFITWWLLFFLWILAQFDDQPLLGLFDEPWNTLIFLTGLLFISLLEWLPYIHRYLKNRRRLQGIHARQQLLTLTPADFEELVAETYRRLGFKVKRVGKSGDHGVDLVMYTPSGERWIVQCKRYRDSVGEGIIRELFGTLHHEKADRAVLATSAEITVPAYTWARGKPIDLVDGAALLRLMEQARHLMRRSLGKDLLNRLWTWAKPRPKHPLRCPDCGAPLIQKPRTGVNQRVLYRCIHYPTCRVTLDEASALLSRPKVSFSPPRDMI